MTPPIGSARAGLVSQVDAIPDSAIAQFDFREEDGTLPLTDQTNNGNDLANGGYTGIGKSINGNQAGEFDASTDRIYDTLTTPSLSQPYTVILVLQSDTTGEYYSFDGTTNASLVGQTTGGTSGWFLNAGGSSINGGTQDTNAHVLTGVFDSTDSVRLDSTQVGSGNAGSNGLDGINIGSASDGNVNYDGAIGLVEVHDGLPSNGLSTREEEIADDWGITV